MEYYFLIAIIFFVINGLAYNLAIKDLEDVPILATIRAMLIYVVLSLFWFVQLYFVIRMVHEELKKDGKSN